MDRQFDRRDSARGSFSAVNEPKCTPFDELVTKLEDILGPSNGIDSAGIDVQEIQKVMAGYASNEEDWAKYAFADFSRAYTRNLVSRGNGKSNLLLLVWTPGKASPIHDHANAHCVMRVLKGSLTETVYSWPCQSDDVECATSNIADVNSTAHTCAPRRGPTRPASLRVQKETILETGGVTYMSDKLGLHRVGNTSTTDVAVSLHLYTPPNAAKHGCHIFDESTGRKSHVQQCHFYSEYGSKME